MTIEDDKKVTPVDAHLFFQRLISILPGETVSDPSQSKLSEALSFEMPSVPASMFDQTTHLVLEADKPKIKEQIWAKTKDGGRCEAPIGPEIS